MKRFFERLRQTEYAQLGNTFALTDETTYDELRSILEEENISYFCTENSYAGIYMIEIDKRQKFQLGE